MKNKGIVNIEPKLIPKTFLKFFIYFLSEYKLSLFFFFVFSFVAGCYGTANSYLLQVLIDRIELISSKSIKNVNYLYIPAFLIVLNNLMHHFSWRGLNYINLCIAPKVKNKIISTLFSIVQNHPYAFFQEHFSGEIANDIKQLADNLEGSVIHATMFIISGIVQLVLAFITMYFVHPSFSIALFTWVCIFMTFSFLYSTKVRNLSSAYAASQSSLSGRILDSLTNILNTRIFARENSELGYLGKYLGDSASTFYTKEVFLLRFITFQGVLINLLIAMVIIILIKLKQHDLVTTGNFVFILGITFYVTENIWLVTEHIDRMNDSIGKCNQSLNKLIIPVKDINSRNTDLVLTKGEIKFDKVNFSYNQNHNIFENLSIKICSGQKVGLVGYSGAGKSTFINLILGLFDINYGKILIDNQDIASVTYESLRSKISVIPQEVSLFNRSLLENIRFGNLNSTYEEVIEAAKKANAHEFIKRLPDGYNTIVGERGVKLSGGQRQRVIIARAILKNAPILIFDEPTSNLDSVTEDFIQQSLEPIMRNKTTLVIAHRFSTLLYMDRVLVFNKGKIIEDGSHQELIINNGLYKTLLAKQTQGFLPNFPNDNM